MHLSSHQQDGHMDSHDMGKHVYLYSLTSESWQAMYEDCEKAETSIEFQQYILHDDDVGRRFLNLFAQKAAQGVTVRLLLDRIGSRQVFASPIIDEIRDHGGQVVFYNPVGWNNIFRPKKWFPRNHVKALLIDSKIAYIGGVCLADYMGPWRDLHARLEGPPAIVVRDNFVLSYRPESHAREALLPDAAAPEFDYMISSPAALRSNPIYRELLAQISKAQRSIMIATPYFLPPSRLRRALRRAAQRGVDVRIIVTQKTDVPLAVCVSQSYFPRLIRSGMRLLFFQPTVFHAKYVIVDDRWAMLGSTNLDYLSLLENRESNLIIRNKSVIADMIRVYQESLGQSVVIPADFWRHVPLHQKILGYAGRAFKKMM